MRLGSRCSLSRLGSPLVSVDVVELPLDFDALKVLFKKNLWVVSVEVSGNFVKLVLLSNIQVPGVGTQAIRLKGPYL